MASTATVTALLFVVLFGEQLVSGNATAPDRQKKTASICKPQPSGNTLGERSTCPFTVTEDKDFRRVPSVIYHFSCNCPASRCSDRDDYRCVQVKRPLEVQVQRFSTVKTMLQKKVVRVNASCVCATPKVQAGAPTQDRILDETGENKIPKDVEGVTKIRINDTADEFDELYF
ncbi:hypothetical protein MTO96_012235 [Rhipicephalus appendiculatus]